MSNHTKKTIVAAAVCIVLLLFLVIGYNLLSHFWGYMINGTQSASVSNIYFMSAAWLIGAALLVMLASKLFEGRIFRGEATEEAEGEFTDDETDKETASPRSEWRKNRLKKRATNTFSEPPQPVDVQAFSEIHTAFTPLSAITTTGNEKRQQTPEFIEQVSESGESESLFQSLNPNFVQEAADYAVISNSVSLTSTYFQKTLTVSSENIIYEEGLNQRSTITGQPESIAIPSLSTAIFENQQQSETMAIPPLSLMNSTISREESEMASESQSLSPQASNSRGPIELTDIKRKIAELKKALGKE